MSTQQGTLVGRGSLRIPMSLIIAALVGILTASVAVVLAQGARHETSAVLDVADLATNEAAIRERHEALGRLDAVISMNPADLATSEAAIRERHEALGRLDAVSSVDPADLATTGAAIRDRHEALGRLAPASPIGD
jgi:hypothetical protein